MQRASKLCKHAHEHDKLALPHTPEEPGSEASEQQGKSRGRESNSQAPQEEEHTEACKAAAQGQDAASARKQEVEQQDDEMGHGDDDMLLTNAKDLLVPPAHYHAASISPFLTSACLLHLTTSSCVLVLFHLGIQGRGGSGYLACGGGRRRRRCSS